MPVAQALVQAMGVLPAEAIHLVLDVDAKVCRLGYGDQDLSGLEHLQRGASQHGLTLNHHPGIRFKEEVQAEVERVKTDFNPRVFKNYKDVTYQTFKDPKFRKLLDGRFGADAVERVFSEHDAAPESVSKPVSGSSGN